MRGWYQVWLGVALTTALTTGLAQAAAPEEDIRRDATVAAIQQVMPSVVNCRTICSASHWSATGPPTEN